MSDEEEDGTEAGHKRARGTSDEEESEQSSPRKQRRAAAKRAAAPMAAAAAADDKDSDEEEDDALPGAPVGAPAAGRATPLAPRTGGSRPGNAAAEEMPVPVEVLDRRVSRGRAAIHVPKKQRSNERVLEPPGPVAMRGRLCALNLDLIEHMKAKFHNREIDAGDVTKWFKQNPAQLEGTGLTVDDVSTDHILPRSVGGLHHIFNYYIMSKSHNSHFKENWTEEKRKFVGKQGVKIAQGFASWCRDKSDVQYFNFRPANYMLSE